MIRDVHLFLIDGFADWETGFATAHIARPAPGFPMKYRVRTVGLKKSPVRSMGGLTVLPDLELSELTPSESAMLILPGSDAWANASADPALAMVRRFVESGVPVAAICGATFGLARAGVLDSRRHTGNDADWLATSGYGGRPLFVREPAVEDQGVITASPVASLEFARLILARLQVFPPVALDAWYKLFKTGDPACFYPFLEALGSAT